VVLTDRDFGDWAKPLWTELGDAVVDIMRDRSAPSLETTHKTGGKTEVRNSS
jgi:hypothetical protein